jgi:AcrR family transcriptional regulator
MPRSTSLPPALHAKAQDTPTGKPAAAAGQGAKPRDAGTASARTAASAKTSPKSLAARRARKPVDAPYHHGDLRAALVEAGLALLQEEGLEGFTLRACARRANVSHGAPAHHFGDVKGLLTACAAQGFVRMSALMEEFRAKAGNSAMLQSRANGMAYIVFAMRHRALFQLMFRADVVDHGSPELKAASQASFGVLESSVRIEALHPSAAPREELLDDMLLRWAAVHGIATLILEGQLDDYRNGVPHEPFAMAVAERVLTRLRKQ